MFQIKFEGSGNCVLIGTPDVIFCSLSVLSSSFESEMILRHAWKLKIIHGSSVCSKPVATCHGAEKNCKGDIGLLVPICRRNTEKTASRIRPLLQPSQCELKCQLILKELILC